MTPPKTAFAPSCSFEDARWLYYRAYVGSGFVGLDHFVATTLPRVLAQDGFDRWFFLRFNDEGGLHVRLRMRTAGSAHADTLATVLEPILIEELATTRSGLRSDYRPMIAPSLLAGRPLWGRPTLDVRLERTPYEPEIEKFGRDGMSIAEEVFDASSRVALTVLSEEAKGGQSRKTWAPTLMHEVRRAFGGSPVADTFWLDYAQYWLAQIEADSAIWMARFAEKSDALARAGLSVVYDFAQTGGPAYSTIGVWRDAISAAAAGFAAIDQLSSRRQRELAFHFMHLMNNRLGVQPIEEAYVAVLLGTELSRS